MRADCTLVATLPTVFTVEGDLTVDGVALLAEWFWPHVLTGPPDTLVDLAQVSTIDAAGLDLLVAAHAYAAHRRIPLRIVNASPRVRRVLQAAGVRAYPARGPRVPTTVTTIVPPQHAAAVMA